MPGSVFSVNLGVRKGEAKRPAESGVLRENWGLEGDSHGGPGEKQISLLSWESVGQQIAAMRENSIECQKSKSLAAAAEDAGHDGRDGPYDIRPGDYAENLTTTGVDLRQARPGDRIEVGSEAVLEVTRIGKECHQHCDVYRRLGDCVMPREGVFARVLRGGPVAEGDEVRLAERGHTDPE